MAETADHLGFLRVPATNDPAAQRLVEAALALVDAAEHDLEKIALGVRVVEAREDDPARKAFAAWKQCPRCRLYAVRVLKDRTAGLVDKGCRSCKWSETKVPDPRPATDRRTRKRKPRPATAKPPRKRCRRPS